MCTCLCVCLPLSQGRQDVCMCGCVCVWESERRCVCTCLRESGRVSVTSPHCCPHWTDCTHNEWAASPPCCGYPRSGHILYCNLSEVDRILYSSLFAGMMSSGHLPLFIRKGCSHVRAGAGWPRLPGVCLGDGEWGAWMMRRRRKERETEKSKVFVNLFQYI